MGESKLLAALAALICAAAALSQGPVYRERWGYMHLERLRDTVWRELDGRDSATRSRVAELLAEPDGGVPFRPAARALAALREAEADDAFVLRATLGAFLLPEVVDPVAENEVCRQLNASLYLPFTVPQPGAIDFAVSVRDRAGATVFESTIVEDTDVTDLRRARAVAKVPCDELPDGTYELEVRTRVDGAGPRPTDQVLRLTFHVLRGYQARSEAAMRATRDVHEGLEPLPRGLLLGLAAEVSRAYQGEAFHGQSEAILDLHRVETALANVEQGEHVLKGLTGDVPVMLPTGSRPLASVVRLRSDLHPATGPMPRPLVVFAGGLPCYDTGATRPSEPSTRGPRSTASALGRFGRNEPWQVAFLESPGNGRDYAATLPAAIGHLRELFATGERPVILVCEREAAAVAGFAVGKLRPVIDGLVLVGAGAMTAPMIDGLGDLPVRVAPLHGYPGSIGIERVLDYVAQQTAAGEWRGDLERLVTSAQPWPFGLRATAGQIAAFVRELAADG